MKALVVFDSVFGNTEKVARAVGEALGAEARRVSEVNAADLAGVELLVVGSPTRGFRATDGMRAWLKALPQGSLKGVKAAGFDTRIAVKEVNNAVLNVMVKIFGYAAEPISASLVKKGAALVAKAEGFFVKASEGPLKEGELERAAVWAQAMK